MSGTNGNIPLSVKIFARAEQTFHYGNNLSVKARAAIFIDASKKELVARDWVTQRDNVASQQCAPEDATYELCPNDPIPYLTLVGTETRGEGSHVWKVVTPEGYLVDLRDDVFLTLLFEQGVPQGGYLKGPFRWIKLGSAMRLAWMESELYRGMEEHCEGAEKEHTATIPPRDLVVGGVYQRKCWDWPETAVFLGPVRISGLKYLSWFVFRQSPDTDLQSSYDREFQEATRYGYFSLRVLSSCPYKTKLGEVQLTVITQTLSVEDGAYRYRTDDFEGWITE